MAIARYVPAGFLQWLIIFYIICRCAVLLSLPEYGPTPVDELLFALMLPLAPVGLITLGKYRLGLFVLACMLVYGTTLAISTVFSSVAFERGIDPIELGIFLEAKPFVILFGFVFLAYASALKGRLELVVRGVCVALIVLGLVNALAIAADLVRGSDLYGVTLRSRSGFVRPNGLLRHPVANAQQMLLSFVGALVLLKRKATTARVALAAVMFIFVAITFQVKETICAVLLIGVFVFFGVRSLAIKVSLVLLGMLALCGAVLLAPEDNPITNHISESVGDTAEDSVRAAMYSASYTVARDNFPFGSGISTFGSEGSRRYGYSSLYKGVGIWGMWGASEKNDRFLLDVFWPKILAEAGIFGLIAYLSMFLAIGAVSLGQNRRNSTGSAFLAISVLTVVAVTSIGSQPFADELLGPVYAFAAAITIVQRRNREVLSAVSNETVSPT